MGLNELGLTKSTQLTATKNRRIFIINLTKSLEVGYNVFVQQLNFIINDQNSF